MTQIVMQTCATVDEALTLLRTARAWFPANWRGLALSGSHWLLADATGVQLTRYPPGLCSALKKLKADTAVVHHATRATAQLWIESPLDRARDHKGSWLNRAFDTHPPLEERIRIPWDLAFLDGHFPNYPVVAGVVQVHFAMRALGELLGAPPALSALEELKFHAVLVPGQEAILRAELYDDGARFRFSLADAADAGRLFASGRGRLETRP